MLCLTLGVLLLRVAHCFWVGWFASLFVCLFVNLLVGWLLFVCVSVCCLSVCLFVCLCGFVSILCIVCLWQLFCAIYFFELVLNVFVCVTRGSFGIG